MSAKRVLDSTPLYDAVATQDTVTMIRSAIRQLLAVADPVLEAELRRVLRRDDDYGSGGKPTCDWDDPAAREQLVAELAADGFACLGVLDGRDLTSEVTDAAELLATVLGQDLEAGDDGRFRIARRGRQGPGHLHRRSRRPPRAQDPGPRFRRLQGSRRGRPRQRDHHRHDGHARQRRRRVGRHRPHRRSPRRRRRGDDAKVYGDSAYGTGEFQQRLDDNDIGSGCRTQPPSPLPGGLFGKDRFDIDLDDDTVTCPAGVTVSIRRGVHGDGIAYFAEHCTTCPLRAQCTNADGGRTIRVNEFEAALARARQRQADPDWQADYRANRPKVERKLAHLMRRRHGGRRARVRGRAKVDADFNLLAAAANLARLATLGLRSTTTGWAHRHERTRQPARRRPSDPDAALATTADHAGPKASPPPAQDHR